MHKSWLFIIAFYSLFLATFTVLAQKSLSDSLLNNIKLASKKDKVLLLMKYAIDLAPVDSVTAKSFAMKAIDIYHDNEDLEGEAKALTILADVYSYSDNYINADQNYRKALAINTKLGNYEEIASNYNYIGLNYYYQNKIPNALSYYTKALNIAKDKYIVVEGNALNNAGNAYKRMGELKQAMTYFDKALPLLSKVGTDDAKKVMAKTYNNIGLIYNEWGKFDKAVEAYNKAEILRAELNDDKGRGIVLTNIGNIYLYQGKYQTALKYSQQALKIFEQINFKQGISSCLNNIAIVYQYINEPEKSMAFNLKALEVRKQMNNKLEIANSYNSLGIVTARLAGEKIEEKYGSPDKASSTQLKAEYKLTLDYYFEALKLCEELNNSNLLARLLNNIGTIYMYTNELNKALVNYNKALSITRQNNIAIQEVLTMVGLGMVYNKQGQYNKAIDILTISVNKAKELNQLDELKTAYQSLSLAFENAGKHNKALENYKLYADLKDTLLNKENYKQMAEMQTLYETDKQQQQIELLNIDKKLKENQIRQQRLAIIFFAVVLTIIAILIVLVIKQSLERKKANMVLAQQNDLITEQKKEITDSIHYASRIQRAILSPFEVVSKLLPQHFILFRPRDIVSGDFYYITEKENKAIIVTADCTGHGVPGAFMSMLGTALLNEVISKSKELQASKLLDDLRSQLVRSLHQTGKIGENRDGMDMQLYIIDFANMQVQYAGANNPLVLVRNGEMIEFKADKMPIGIHDRICDPFTNNIINIQKDDLLYTFSDGYVDQFGGPDQKKFMSKRFKQMLSEMGTMSMPQQRDYLENRLVEWMGDLAQIDDVLVIGVRIT